MISDQFRLRRGRVLSSPVRQSVGRFERAPPPGISAGGSYGILTELSPARSTDSTPFLARVLL